MAFLVGTVLALAVGIFARGIGLDRDRAFYPTVMIVIAFLYALFAATAGAHRAIVVESLVGSVFAGLAVWGFRGSLWLVVLALAGHGIFDSFHAGVIFNPGVPVWWPPFCLTYDIAAAAFLAWLLWSRRLRAVA